MELTFGDKHDIILRRNKNLTHEEPVERDSIKVVMSTRTRTKKGESNTHQKALLVAERRANGCSVCGYNRCKHALDFHHKNPKEKKFIIRSKLATVTLGDFIKELNKCVVLCANCHREVHAGVLVI